MRKSVPRALGLVGFLLVVSGAFQIASVLANAVSCRSAATAALAAVRYCPELSWPQEIGPGVGLLLLGAPCLAVALWLARSVRGR
jgi:hypothetical protein